MWDSGAKRRADSSQQESERDREQRAVEFRLGQNLELLFTFFEWRHKILTRYAVTLAALAIAFAWIRNNESNQPLLALPFFTAAGLSVLAWHFDRVHTVIIDICYANGRRLEKRLGACSSEDESDIGIYAPLQVAFKKKMSDGEDTPLLSLDRFRQNRMSYRRALTGLYLGGGCTFLVVGLLVLFDFDYRAFGR